MSEITVSEKHLKEALEAIEAGDGALLFDDPDLLPNIIGMAQDRAPLLENYIQMERAFHRACKEKRAWEEMAEAEANYNADPDSRSAKTRWKQASAAIADLARPEAPKAEACPECVHEWKDHMDSQSGRDCFCVKCRMAGERQEDGTVFYPAT